MPWGRIINVNENKKAGAEVANELSRRQPSPGEQRWQEQTLKPALLKSPERQEVFTTLSGVPIDRLYTPADLADFDYSQDLA